MPIYDMHDVLCGVTASACDHRYGLVLSLIMFLGLKVDFACIAQWKNINPRHYV